MRVLVKIFGHLKKTNSGKIELKLSRGSNVGTVINTLLNEDEELKKSLMDPIMNSPKPNSLILLNGVEIGNLQGLNTIVDEDAQLVILPVTHGG